MAELWTGYAWPTIIIVLQIVAIIIPLLLGVAYLTYAERKVLAAMQLRQDRTWSVRSASSSRLPTG